MVKTPSLIAGDIVTDALFRNVESGYVTLIDVGVIRGTGNVIGGDVTRSIVGLIGPNLIVGIFIAGYGVNGKAVTAAFHYAGSALVSK